MVYYFFDFHGVYLGYMDAGGRLFDPAGVLCGQRTGRREVRDSSGAVLGVIDAQGSVFAADGTCRGYLRDATATPPRVGRAAEPEQRI